MKIGQCLAKIWTRVHCSVSVFLTHGVDLFPALMTIEVIQCTEFKIRS